MVSAMRIFISCVSSEFADIRQALERDLDLPGIVVVCQEKLPRGGKSLLEKLDDTIRGCAAVIHIVGIKSGAVPTASEVVAVNTKYPTLQYQYSFLKASGSSNSPLVSYTQWEAWLALYHGKACFVYRVDPKDLKHKETDSLNDSIEQMDDCQSKHWGNLKCLGKDYVLCSRIDLRAKIMHDCHRAILVFNFRKYLTIGLGICVVIFGAFGAFLRIESQVDSPSFDSLRVKPELPKEACPKTIPAINISGITFVQWPDEFSLQTLAQDGGLLDSSRKEIFYVAQREVTKQQVALAAPHLSTEVGTAAEPASHFSGKTALEFCNVLASQTTDKWEIKPIPLKLWSIIANKALEEVLSFPTEQQDIGEIIRCSTGFSGSQTIVSQTREAPLFDVLGSVRELVLAPPDPSELGQKVITLGGDASTSLEAIANEVHGLGLNVLKSSSPDDASGLRPVIVGNTGLVNLRVRSAVLGKQLVLWIHRSGENPYSTYLSIDPGHEEEWPSARMGWYHVVVQDDTGRNLFREWRYVHPLTQVTWMISEQGIVDVVLLPRLNH